MSLEKLMSNLSIRNCHKMKLLYKCYRLEIVPLFITYNSRLLSLVKIHIIFVMKKRI